MYRFLALTIAIAFSSAACQEDPTNKPVPAAASKEAAPDTASKPVAPTPERTPRGPTDYPTNEGPLALSNLSSQIDGQEQVFQKTGSPVAQTGLAAQLLFRGQVTGKIADYERALVLANEILKAHPKDPAAYLIHAQAMTTFHRFDDALADYKRAEKLGVKPIELIAPREDIAAARGNDAEALAYREKLAKQMPGIDTLGALAVTVGDTGDLKRASQLFGDAQDSYRNISPFPVAMLYFQNGLLEQKLGSATRARVLFQAAHDRLPCYPQATAHLASILEATGQRDQAIELLRTAIKTSDDPEFVGQLAAALKAAGKNDEAAALHKQAADRYDELIKKYPLAFSDHAARFWLLPDGDAKRALALAQVNLKNRATVDALRLVLDAAMAAADNALACKTAETLLARPFVTAPSRVAASKAFMACGQKERGEKELATAMTPATKPDAKPDTTAAAQTDATAK